jgi:hypothetical protein
MVVFLVGMVVTILLRTLNKDYARYGRVDDVDDIVSFIIVFLIFQFRPVTARLLISSFLSLGDELLISISSLDLPCW